LIDEILVADLGISAITKHGMDQIMTRGVSPGAILDALNNPIRIRVRTNGTTQIIGQGATVVVNNSGGIVTVWGQ
jgi:hypothetical protein